jgi:lysozyme
MTNPKFEEGLKIAIPELKKHEGFRDKAYKDVAGVVTIGYGFTNAVIPNLKMGDVLPRPQADELLLRVLREKYATPLANAIKVWNDPKFTAKMFSALVTMIWQIGPSMLRHQIIKRINEKNYSAAADLIMQKDYMKAGGIVHAGLYNRRKAEFDAFRSGMLVKVAAGSGILFLLIGTGIFAYWYLRKKKLAQTLELRAAKRALNLKEIKT